MAWPSLGGAEALTAMPEGHIEPCNPMVSPPRSPSSSLGGVGASTQHSHSVVARSMHSLSQPLPMLSAGAAELSRLTSTLQQQLTLRHAASSIFESLPGGNLSPRVASVSGALEPEAHLHVPSAGGTARTRASLASFSSSGMGSAGLVRRETNPIGLRRAVMSLRSVRALPLSVAAKTTIINTIADSALAAFVVIQVRCAHHQHMPQESFMCFTCIHGTQHQPYVARSNARLLLYL